MLHFKFSAFPDHMHTITKTKQDSYAKEKTSWAV